MEGVVEHLVVLGRVVLDSDALQYDILRAVAGDHKLALRVILGELSSVHQQVCALFEAVVKGQRDVRVCLSATMDVLLRDDLSLGLTKQLTAKFSEDQPDGWVLVVWVAS